MFVHLHVHSDNSILNGVIKVEKIVKTAHEYEMPAVALTDNGTMYPTFSFFSKCKGEGVKPIFGCQVNVAPRTRFDKEAKKDEKTTELVVLAKHREGYINLIRLVSKGHLEGFYYKPRVDKDLIKELHDGLIVLSGGENSEIFRHFLLGNNEQAKEVAQWYKDIFGEDFYIEIQRTGIHAQEIVNPKLIDLARELDIPIVATNNVYYAKQEDAEAREVLWCIDGGRLMSDPARRRPETDQEYFRTPAEMEELFKDLPEAIENTMKIADKVEAFDIGFGKVQPVYPNIPEGMTEEQFLRKLVYDNGPARFGYWTPELIERLEYELKVVHDKGYDGYFLVMWSIVNWARSQGIMVSTRGSAAGAAMSFAIGITTLDPVKWKLFFERFLNPERKSLPDIDLDISDNRREDIIQWCKETYGYDNFSNVGALGKLTTKAAIRDVGRVLGIDLSIIDKLSKLIPVKFGRVTSIGACLSDDLATKELKVIEENREAVTEFRRLLRTDDGVNDSPELVDIKMCTQCFSVYYDGDKTECKKCHIELKTIATTSKKFAKLIKLVQKIDGCIRQVSTHACGHLITPGPIINYCPVQIETGSGKRIITQMEGKYLEEIGLMKFDFLGLANLSIIDNAVKFIKEFKGLDIDIFNIPQDDKKTFELLQRADTTAVFQLESPGMRKYLKELHPETIEEISAMCALYRPGPIQFIPAFIDRKFGREQVKYLIPEIEDIMNISYGLPVYQEQILQIANRVAGYSLGEADNLRRAIGKKLPEVMAAEEKKFKEGVVKNTKYDEKIADELWKYAQPFADYGFNKAHSAAYAFVAYQTAWLKANYPTEFAAALMLSDIDTLDKLVRDILDAQERGIKILQPDVNNSDAYFKIEEEGVIRFGIGGLKGVGLKAIQSLVEERKANGPFKSLDDICERINHKEVSKGAIEALIKIGAMSEFGTRAGLLQIFEDVYTRCQKLKATSSAGAFDMFGGDDGGTAHNLTKVPEVPEVDDPTKIEWEKEILGIPLTPSLLMKIVPFIKSKKFMLLNEVPDAKEESMVRVFGQVKAKKVITTKKGDEMCFIDLIDATGKVSVTVFPKLHAKVCSTFEAGDYINVKGKTQKRNDEMQILASSIAAMKETEIREKWMKWQKNHKDEIVEESDDGSIATTFKKKESSPKPEQAEAAKPESATAPEEKSASRAEPVKQVDEVKVQNEKTNHAPTATITAQVLEPASNPVQEPAAQQDTIEPKKETPMNKVIEIYVKKDAYTDDLKQLSEMLKQNVAEAGCEVYVHIPNHESVRKIKLEGKYNETVEKLESMVIEDIKCITIE